MKKGGLLLIAVVAIAAAALYFYRERQQDQIVVSAEERADAVVKTFWQTCGAHLPDFDIPEDTFQNAGLVNRDGGWQTADGLISVMLREEAGLPVCDVIHANKGMTMDAAVFLDTMNRQIGRGFVSNGVTDFILTGPLNFVQYKFGPPGEQMFLSNMKSSPERLGGIWAVQTTR